MSQVCRMLMQHLSPQIVICVHGRSIFDPRFQNVPLSLVRGGGPQANAKGSLPTNTLGTRSRHVLRLSQWERLLQPLLPFWWLRVMRIAFGILNDLFFSHFSAWIRTHHLRNPNPWYRLAKKKRATNKNHSLRHMLLSYICIQIYFRTPRLKPSLSLFPVFPQFLDSSSYGLSVWTWRLPHHWRYWRLRRHESWGFSTGQGRLPGLRDAFSGLLWYL